MTEKRKAMTVVHMDSRVFANGIQIAMVSQDRVTRKWDVNAFEGSRQGALIASCDSHAAAIKAAENYGRREGLIN